MKVIGRVGANYLVEASGEELTKAAGYDYLDGKVPGTRRTADYNSWEFVLGANIDVARIFNWLRKLREREGECRSATGFLRGMADMIDAGLPSTIVPPEEPPASESA